MWTIGVVLPYIFGLLIVVSVGVGVLRFSRGNRLGPALLSNSDSSLTTGWVWLLLGLSEVFDYLHGEAIGLVCLHARGVCVGGGFLVV